MRPLSNGLDPIVEIEKLPLKPKCEGTTFHLSRSLLATASTCGPIFWEACNVGLRDFPPGSSDLMGELLGETLIKV